VIEVSSSESLRESLGDWRHDGEHIALIPTMGNLHDGHLSLVTLAREHAERIVVSIFVNPTQFSEDEDFEQYPRTLERDRRLLKRVNADLLFVPDVDTMYPFGLDNATSVTVPVLTADFCGAFRPGHFDGVTSVVSRLFSIVQPDVAIFGQKDYQQLLVIRRLVEDLRLPIKIVLAPTKRAEDGLALSSRNQYLSEQQRDVAPTFYAVLQGIGKELQAGKRNYQEIEKQAIATLTDAGFDPEYIGIRRAENLEKPDRDNDEIVVLAATRLGNARLIDNILVSI
jgi:pantoate--beta-alanine ligase